MSTLQALIRLDVIDGNVHFFSMKKFLYRLLVILAVIGLVFVLGPRPDSQDEITFDPASIGPDIDAYLAKVETGIPNLNQGAAKEVIWADPAAKQKTPYAFVYLHGFSATKYETRPVPDDVARTIGANLYFARFKGHGRDGNGLAEATVQDWANDYAEAVAIGERIGEKIIIMAASNGAMISTWGLEKQGLSKNIAGVIYVSPNFELRGISTWLANIPWAETILPAVAGEHREWEPKTDMHRKWWTYSYPSRAIFPVTAMLKTVKQYDLSTIKVPALFFYSPADTVVDIGEIEKAIERWGGPTETVRINDLSDNSNHVIMGDALNPEQNASSTAKIIKWINGLDG